jgi:hypothetical protein
MITLADATAKEIWKERKKIKNKGQKRGKKTKKK